NPNPIVGYINPGLASSVTGAPSSFTQCTSTGGSFAGLLNFKENFGTAFKTRVDGLKNLTNTNYYNGGAQNVPGTAFNSESNFIANNQGQGTIGTGLVGNGNIIAGLADYGTRLKAVFTNVPAGATVYVATTNVLSQNNNSSMMAVPNPGNATTATSYAVLLAAGSEALADPSFSPVSGAVFTNTFNTTSTGSWPTTALQYVIMTSQGAPMVAVWEVLNTQPTFQETISFPIYIAYTSTATFPPQGNSQVAFSFAANPTNGAISATNAGTNAINTPIPRFADSSGSTINPIGNFFNVALCQTVLLFPYVTTAVGWETGIQIANTTTDPFGTTPQQGTCTLYWYNTGAPNPPNFTTALIPSGTVFTSISSTYTGSGFNGYMIAKCYFLLAHGAAVITDYGAQKIVSVYLALVVPTGSGNRNGYSNTAPEALSN
ncbi:MAG TPA: hypothetical protein VKF41_09030, partial [Bryobacteraceae bacterium]|nr:hypothetical protein [Bryobacteraceae bacterium]